MAKEKKSTLPMDKQIEGIPWIVGDAARTYWEAEFTIPYPIDAVDAVAYKSLQSAPTAWDINGSRDVPGLVVYKFSTADKNIDLGSLEIRKLKDNLTEIKTYPPEGVSVGDLTVKRLTGQSTVAIETRIAFQRSIVQQFLYALWQDGMLIKNSESDISSVPSRKAITKTQPKRGRNTSALSLSIPEPTEDPSNVGPFREAWFRWYFWMKELKIRLPNGRYVTYEFLAQKVSLSPNSVGEPYRNWGLGYDDSVDREYYESGGWLKDGN